MPAGACRLSSESERGGGELDDAGRRADCLDGSGRVALDMESSESPVHGEQVRGVHNGHFESICYHPLFLFNDICLANMAFLTAGLKRRARREAANGLPPAPRFQIEVRCAYSAESNAAQKAQLWAAAKFVSCIGVGGMSDWKLPSAALNVCQKGTLEPLGVPNFAKLVQ